MQHQPDITQQSDGLWISISDLAARKNVTKQTISERVARLVGEGRLTTRSGKGRAKLINLAEFDRAVGDTTDLSKQQGARTKAGDDPAGGKDPTFTSEQARRAGYEAELKRLDLEERLGKLRSVDDITAAAVICGEAVVREIESMSLRADEVAAAVAKDGVNGARQVLKDIQFKMRKRMEDTFSRLAAGIDAENRQDDEAHVDA